MQFYLALLTLWVAKNLFLGRVKARANAQNLAHMEITLHVTHPFRNVSATEAMIASLLSLLDPVCVPAEAAANVGLPCMNRGVRGACRRASGLRGAGRWPA